MIATRMLPDRYRKVGTLDVRQDQRLLVFLNLGGLLLMVIAGWLFFRFAAWLHPVELATAILPLNNRTSNAVIGLILGILILFIFHIILHEAIHGLFFWLFTHSRPLFAFRWAYAYAAAPDWYIFRNPFFIITLAPFVLITLVGLLIIAFAPAAYLLPTWFVITLNAGGAIGDLAVAAWLLRQPAACLAQDRGDAVTLYIPV
jgi:hypothetical protein